MEYQISHVVTYWVTAESAQEALDKWNNHPNTGAEPWKDGDVELYDDHVEVNGY